MISSSSTPRRSSPLASSSSSAASTSPASSVSSVSSVSSASVNRSTMSITQTYYLAHRARSKLGSEASRSDHNLRVLVGHANLLDTLMLELAAAEREQETWYHSSPHNSTKDTAAAAASSSPSSSQTRHIQWADQYVSQGDSDSDSSSDDWDVSSTEDEEESDDEDFDDHIPETSSALRRMPAHAAAPFSPSVVTISAVDSDSDFDSDAEYDSDAEEDLSQLSLVRTPSHSGSASGSPPELALDCDFDESSDDEADMPPSPPAATIDIYRASSKSSGKESLFLTVPPRSPSRLVSNVSVY